MNLYPHEAELTKKGSLLARRERERRRHPCIPQCRWRGGGGRGRRGKGGRRRERESVEAIREAFWRGYEATIDVDDKNVVF